MNGGILMKRVAKFEKVSVEQYCRDHMGYEYDETCTDTKKEYDNIQLPLRKTKGSAGYDFIAPFDIIIPPHSTLKFVTGVKCQIEDGYLLELYPRSNLGFKHRLSLNNTVGIIDSDYYNNKDNEGHIQCKFYNPNDYEVVIKEGEAYMQGIFKEFFLADEEEVTTERTGGIGSTNS